MRITTSGCWGAICVCFMVVATTTAGERGDRVSKAAARAAAAVPVADQAPINLMDLVSPLPKNPKVTRDVVMAGGAGKAAPDSGSAAAVAVKVYSNTLGTESFGPSSAGSRIADDIATTGCPDCALDHYVIRVTGDRNGIGDTRPFKVTVALYDSCPGATTLPRPIAVSNALGVFSTECVREFTDGGVHDIVCTIPALVTIPLPSTLYIAVTFDRTNTGWVVGAPAEQGFSADRFDFPGFPCAAGFGGFPRFPHASFYAEIYARDCGRQFAAYRSTKQSGEAFTPGRFQRFADDITLTRSDCKLKSVEVSVKGTCTNCSGAVLVDLKTSLSNTNPETGNRIPGTFGQKFVFKDDVQILQFGFDPPIQLNQNQLFITFLTGSDVVGPIVTGRQADIGSTGDTYAVYQGIAPGGEWTFLDFPDIWSAFDVTVFCEGDPPAGACCDMFIVDENGDSVCRDLPEINCASSQTAPALWQEGKQCGVTDAGDPALCQGGDNDGQPCSRLADCPGANCVGGFSAGDPCVDDFGCPGNGGRCVRATCPGPFFKSCGIAACCLFDDSCEDDTQNGCDAIAPTNEPRLFTRGTFCNVQGQTCPKGSCLGREGECTLPRPAVCLFGDDAGADCDPTATRPPPNVTGCHGVCIRSSQNGAPCLGDSACPNFVDPVNPNNNTVGLCARTQCQGGANDGEPCRNDSQCFQGDCSIPNCPGTPGCQDPFCCTVVCGVDAFCCDIHWDETCSTTALQECGFLRVANDNCSDPDPASGARLLNVPDNVDGDTNQSSGSPDDPGFCCNGDDPGGPGLGTIWYKFVVPPPTNPGDPFTSVGIQTCQSNNDDSLIQLFALENQDEGVCSDLALCSVSAQNCADGSVCEQDPIACNSLIPIGCSDDNDACSGQFPDPLNAKLCAPDLIPGDTYYFMVAAKASADPDVNNRGIYRVIIGSPCSAPPPLPNDLCVNAMPLGGSTVKVDFDLSGATIGTSPVTFDCPGPNCNSPSFPMFNDAWYEWVAPANGQVEIDTCGGFMCVGGSGDGQPCGLGGSCPGVGTCMDVTPQTSMVIYEGCGCPADVFREIECSFFVTQSGCNLGSSSTFDVVKDTCYQIRLGGRSGGTPAGDLEIALNECPSGGAVLFSNPSSGVLDARQPHEPDDASTPQGIQSVTVSGPPGFEAFVNDLTFVRACWSLCESDTSVQVFNGITSITDNGDGTFNLNLLRPMTPGAVTTLTYTAGDGAISVGTFTVHPGNVDGGPVADGGDVSRIRQCLMTPNSCSVWECDADQSGSCGPADLLRVIDLLNGGDQLAPWMGTAKPDLGICAPFGP